MIGMFCVVTALALMPQNPISLLSYVDTPASPFGVAKSGGGGSAKSSAGGVARSCMAWPGLVVVQATALRLTTPKMKAGRARRVDAEGLSMLILHEEWLVSAG